MSAPDLNVVTLYDTNARDVPATLRKLAESIERGEYGDVGTLGVAMLGDSFEVSGMGLHADSPSVGMVLHAGFLRMSQAIEQHGKETA